MDSLYNSKTLNCYSTVTLQDQFDTNKTNIVKLESKREEEESLIYYQFLF
jgi:hypothetical protein